METLTSAPCPPIRLYPLLPTLGSLTPKWRFRAPSESVSFESAATAERRPLSLTESAQTRRHGEGTARSRQANQMQIRERCIFHVSFETKAPKISFSNFIEDNGSRDTFLQFKVKNE